MKTMKHFYFVEEETGEEFLVGAYTFAAAHEIAEDVAESIAKRYAIHPELSYEYEMTDDEAEESGLDEY